jgi:acylphosphatase
VMGSPEVVERIVAWARRGPRSAVVAAVEVFAGEGSFDSFDERPTE